ncbi:mRNA decay activator protein ZFP36L1-like [Xyrauchen texanus]|uniref:mRNA decay activator protein ZFP36L1-like n=1 Tax=Xyrauchen texanus TaxID=154827 RepID=UPI002242C469|nr:mRNA decay activator protein ZFP36L1-like [Xyrauchen texanus]
MPSNFLAPFLELDDEFCKSFRCIDLTDDAQKQRVVGFQRRHSLCPITMPNSKFNSTDSRPWPLSSISQHWHHEQKQQLPRSSLNHIPFRVDRSVSMIEGHVSRLGVCESNAPTSLPPPPGLSISNSSLASPRVLCVSTEPVSTRYKTELCRTYEESGTCKYGAKCQFAHGMEELRGLSRHPKYKTEPCRTFHSIGFCPYGARCHFIHNADEQHGLPEKSRERPQLLRQSVSFSGFSSQPHALNGFHAVPDALAFSRSSSVSPPPSTGSPDLLSPMFPEPGTLNHSYPFADLGNKDTPRFYAINDSKAGKSNLAYTLTGLTALQRSASADSLSDQDGYTSSSSLSDCDSPGIEGRRLPIFSRLSV